jgi:VWFA-related protein
MLAKSLQRQVRQVAPCTRRQLWMAGLLLLGVCPLFAQEPVATTETLHVGTQLVLVDAQVVNRRTGQAVTGLVADDFDLREDDVPQTVKTVSQDKLPLSLVFLFDTTDTVHPVLWPLALGARRVLGHLREGDEVAVMTVSTHGTLVQKFTTDQRKVVQGFADASDVYDKDQATFIFEDVYAATEEAMRSTVKDSRRVEIWLTDGTANFETPDMIRNHGHGAPAVLHTKKQAEELLLKSNAVVSVVLETSELSREEQLLHLEGRTGDLAELANLTGGPVVASSAIETVDQFAGLLDRLRQRYTLGYKPLEEKPKGTVCRLSLALSPGFVLRHPEMRARDLLVKTRVSYTR